MALLISVLIAAAAAGVLFLITCLFIGAVNTALDSSGRFAFPYILLSVIAFGFFATLTICAVVAACKLSITWLTLTILF